MRIIIGSVIRSDGLLAHVEIELDLIQLNKIFISFSLFVIVYLPVHYARPEDKADSSRTSEIRVRPMFKP